MLVFGAIAATSAARVMKVAAEPARAPSGATHAITGTSLSRIATMMRSMLVSSPPGELMTINAAAYPSSAATRSASSTYAALTWSMTPLSSMRATPPSWAPAGAARPITPNARLNAASTRRFMG